MTGTKVVTQQSQILVVTSYKIICSIFQSELAQQKACDLFEQISDKSKEELIDFKARRIADFRKNLVDLAELEIKHGKVNSRTSKVLR